MAPINKCTSLSLLELPRDVLVHTFAEVIAGGYVSSLALTNHRCKEIADTLLVLFWNRIKSPNADLPKGLVDLPSLIGRIVQSHPENTNPRILFREITKEFTNLGATITKGKLPLTTAVLHDLQCEVTNVQDHALLATWPKIAVMLQTAPQLQTASAIRAWLTNPTSAPVLNGITELDLSGLKLKVLPPEITRLAQLQKLFLNDNQLSSLPKEIGALAQLCELNLSNNRLVSMPNAFRDLTQLSKLNLFNNQLVSLPKEIGALAQLSEFDLSNNQLVSLPNEIGALAQLRTLNLSNNKLSSIPDKIGALGQLLILDLSHNQISLLPKEIGALRLLETLNLSTNQLILLPKAIRALTQLRKLNVSNNQLTMLPKGIGSLTKLRELYLENNRLVSLPKEIKSLKHLTLLILSNNQLTTLPDAIKALTKLATLEVSGNPIMFVSHTLYYSNIHGLVRNATLWNYKQELAHECESPLAKLYQSIIQKQEKSKIKTVFYALSSDDKVLVWQYANQGKHRSMDDRVFDDRVALGLGVRKAISTKFERLSLEKKSEVCFAFRQLANWLNAISVMPNAMEVQFGKRQVLNNLPRLADVMAALKNPAQQD